MLSFGVTAATLIAGVVPGVQPANAFSSFAVSSGIVMSPTAMTVAVSHTALVLLAGRPASGDLAADTWARVRSRLGVVAGVVVGVAVLAQLVRSIRVPGQLALAVLALVAVSLWLWWGTRSAERPES